MMTATSNATLHQKFHAPVPGASCTDSAFSVAVCPGLVWQRPSSPGQSGATEQCANDGSRRKSLDGQSASLPNLLKALLARFSKRAMRRTELVASGNTRAQQSGKWFFSLAEHVLLHAVLWLQQALQGLHQSHIKTQIRAVPTH